MVMYFLIKWGINMEINLIFLVSILVVSVYFFKKVNNLKNDNKYLTELLQNKESELNAIQKRQIEQLEALSGLSAEDAKIELISS